MSASVNEITYALELAVTFSGVFLAFMLDRLIDWRKDQKTKEELLRSLANELDRLKDTLTVEIKEVHRLFPNVWDSAIASGKLNLLDPKQLAKLAEVYRIIKETDYEAMRVRDAEDTFDETLSNEARRKFGILNQRHIQRIQKTVESIDEVLKENWICG